MLLACSKIKPLGGIASKVMAMSNHVTAWKEAVSLRVIIIHVRGNY